VQSFLDQYKSSLGPPDVVKRSPDRFNMTSYVTTTPTPTTTETTTTPTPTTTSSTTTQPGRAYFTAHPRFRIRRGIDPLRSAVVANLAVGQRAYLEQLAKQNVSLPSPLNPDLAMILSRVKRGFGDTFTKQLMNGAGELLANAAANAVGWLAGNVASNLVTSVVDWINPNSIPNRVDKLETAMVDLKENFDILKDVTSNVERWMKTVKR